MDEIQDYLKPITDALPEGVQEFLEAGGWWLVLAIVVLVVLLILAWLLRGLKRTLFGRRKAPVEDADRGFHENLAECPLPIRPPGDRQLTVYHLPVRLRLIIVAPPGTGLDVDATQVERLLDLIVPGLGAIVLHDRPRIRVWPGHLSHQGFAAAFHRRVHNPDPEGRPSRWVLVAGRAHVGRQPVLLGMGLWADEPNAIGQVFLEPHQWLDVLRIRATGE